LEAASVGSSIFWKEDDLMAKGKRKPAMKTKAKAAKKPAKGKAARPAAKPMAKAKAKAKAKVTKTVAAKKPAKAAAKAVKSAKAGKAAKPASKAARPAPAAKPAKGTAKAKAPPPRAPLRPTGRMAPARDYASDREERDTSVSAAFPPVGTRVKSKMPHIDDATLAKIIAKLDEMRAESQAVVNEQVATDLSAKEQVGDVGDDLDQAVTERDREFNLIMHQRHLRRLQQIQDARQRIEDGVYGFCEGTDEPINPRRLVIMPLARYSLEYQEQQEKMLGRSPEDTYAPADEAFTVEE
jgi:RNA polymerase-binding protein DksA